MINNTVRLKEDQQLAIALRKRMEDWLTQNNMALVTQLTQSKKVRSNRQH